MLGHSPGKKSVQPEVLGLGFAKLVVTGFTSLVMIHVPKMLEVVAKVPSCIWELGFKESPFGLAVLQNIVKSLTDAQVNTFVELMGDDICKCTVGAGDMIVCPQGRATKVL